MTKTIFVSILFFSTILSGYESVAAQTSSTSRVNVQIITDEADAVLQILAKKERGKVITEDDWRKVFESEGYIRLKKREHSLQRAFEDADFKTFALSENLAENRQALAETLAKWKEINIIEVAERPLAYLPKDARIRAKVYPVIKPRENSFVFDIPDDPAIFLYLDPAVNKEKFENTLAHELHHIGFGSSCPSEKIKTKTETLSPNEKTVLKWLGAFGEGFAMLAAAGGVDVHPHIVSLPPERERWDKECRKLQRRSQTSRAIFSRRF